MKGKLNMAKGKGRSWFYFCMCAMVAVFLCAVFMTAAADGITTKDKNAKEAVDKAIKALGGKEKIDGIKSLVIKATMRSTASQPGISETPTDFEIRVLFPDNIIQINRHPEKKTVLGFQGVSKGKAVRPLPKQVDENSTRADEMRAASYPSLLQQSLRSVLGMIMKSGSTSVTISSGAKPGVFEMRINTGQKYYDNTPDEIEFDADGYPSVIRHLGIANLGGELRPIEQRFSERFSVDGIMFPRVITNNGPISSVVRIEEVQINPKLSLKDFEIPR